MGNAHLIALQWPYHMPRAMESMIALALALCYSVQLLAVEMWPTLRDPSRACSRVEASSCC